MKNPNVQEAYLSDKGDPHVGVLGEVRYWLIEKNRYTGEKTFGVGRNGPRMIIQGEEIDVENLVACFNGDLEKCKL
jgi:hypothetical protein